jgi:hypothetical protein
MKRNDSARLGALFLAIIAFVMASCFSGLDPAQSASGTASLTISAAPLSAAGASGDTGSRAIVQGPAKLYVQTGFEAGTARLFGPYNARAGSETVVRDIPPGSYPWIALLYSADDLSLAEPIILSGVTDPRGAFQAALSDLVSPGLSVALVPGVTIAEGRNTRVSATLVPVTDAFVIAAVGGENPYSRATVPGILDRRFIALSGLGSGVPSGNALVSSTFALSNTGAAAASFSNAALYDSSGTRIGSLGPASGTVAAGGEAILFSYASSIPSASFLYLEYDGSGYSIGVRNTLATRLVLATSTGNAYWSEDGMTWHGPFATGLTVGAQAATAGTGVFAVTGTVGVSSSPDGEAWTLHAMPNTVTSVTCVSSNPSGELMAIGYYGATQSTYRSVDGVSWLTYGSVNYVATNAAWLDGKWYVTTTNGSGWKSSTDGVTWTALAGTGSGMYQMNRIIGLNGRLISGGGQPANAGTQIQVSTDHGATFAGAITIPGAFGYVNSFATVGASRLVVGSEGSGQLLSVTDDYGATWVSTSYPGTAAVKALCATPLGLYAGDYAGNLFRSTDGGINFALVTTFPSGITGITFRTMP